MQGYHGGMTIQGEQMKGACKRMDTGVLTGLICYVLWGLFPLYWRLLDGVNQYEIVAQRVIWCFVFTALICAVVRVDSWKLLKQPRARRFLIPASILITLNWSLYIVAVATGHVIETSIGYYLNPLVSIVLGMVCFQERLTPLQWVAVALCATGIILFTIGYGSFPAIAICLAVSFGTYGAVKKRGGYPALEAIAVESAVMTPVAIVFAVVLAITTGGHAFMGSLESAEGWKTTALLVGGGAVTAIPLILFAKAANSIPLTLLGFLQYISPTLALIVGVFVFGEPFTTSHAVCFGLIWCGCTLVIVDSLLPARRFRAEEPRESR